MNYEASIARGLVEDLLNAIYKYEDSITVATAVGCLEIAKLQLLESQMEEEDED